MTKMNSSQYFMYRNIILYNYAQAQFELQMNNTLDTCMNAFLVFVDFDLTVKKVHSYR